ncbi:Uncharacterized protein HZ326_29772, partial [Fusarium oxysporum f. sp. albedinis]
MPVLPLIVLVYQSRSPYYRASYDVPLLIGLGIDQKRLHLTDERDTPLATSIKTTNQKLTGGGVAGPAQPGTWVGAHFRHLESLPHADPDSLPMLAIIFVDGADWRVDFAQRTPDKPTLRTDIILSSLLCNDSLGGAEMNGTPFAMVRRVYTEDDVAEAILDITDRGLSQTGAAQKRGVPRSTLSGRLSGQASRNERIQAHQRISKSQEETLLRWVLRQESLGYALSHSQLRACVEAILKQQGDNKPLGKHWTTRFVKRHLELSTKLGKRQEAARFDGFTPKAVNWYFDIREDEYGWIKPENTVNMD